MKRHDVITLIKANLKLLKKYHIKSLSLFGSVARDEATDKSDIDVLVEFDGAATFDRYMELKFQLENLLHNKVDLVTKKAIKPRTKKYIEKDLIHVA